tara:strand:- start:72 stop:281 length:210 start_codon:yes stop_codon:yes gene_type:complete
MNVRLNLGEDATAHLFARGFAGDNGKSLGLKAIKAQIAKMDGDVFRARTLESTQQGLAGCQGSCPPDLS